VVQRIRLEAIKIVINIGVNLVQILVSKGDENGTGCKAGEVAEEIFFIFLLKSIL